MSSPGVAPLMGAEYPFSARKRGLDLAIASLAAPGYVGGRLIVGKCISPRVIFNQNRIGQAGVPFDIHKLLTIEPGQTNPVNDLALFLRRSGLDEVGQVRNIFRGEMSVVGFRPLPPDEHEEFLDNLSGQTQQRWTDVVLPTRPGIIGTFGVGFHIEGHDRIAPSQCPEKAESEIKDVIDGSLRYDLELLMHATASMLSNKFA